MRGEKLGSGELEEDGKVEDGEDFSEVGFLQIHKQVHHIGQHVGIERLVLFCLLKFGW